jgi:hypothetical protein
MTSNILLKGIVLVGLDNQAINKLLTEQPDQSGHILIPSEGKGLGNRHSAEAIYPNGYYSYNGIGFNLIKQPNEGKIKKTKKQAGGRFNVFMGETTVTQELYEAVMGSNPSNFKNKPDSPQRPVENVTWYDCIQFCNKLSDIFNLNPYYNIKKIGPKPQGINVEAKGGNGFRLPTEAEWLEFAKAGTKNKWAGTNKESEVKRVAWFKDNSKDQTHPVAQLLPNEWGLYDMNGNVSEWCWNEDAQKLKQDSHVYRMGSYTATADIFVAQKRLVPVPFNPLWKMLDTGFRICRTIES